MKYLEEELHQILLGCDYEMRVSNCLISITLTDFISDYALRKVLEAVHRKKCLILIFAKDENHIGLSISKMNKL